MHSQFILPRRFHAQWNLLGHIGQRDREGASLQYGHAQPQAPGAAFGREAAAEGILNQGLPRGHPGGNLGSSKYLIHRRVGDVVERHSDA